MTARHGTVIVYHMNDAHKAAHDLDADSLRRLASDHGVASLTDELRRVCLERGFLAMTRAAEGELSRRAGVEE